MATRTVTSERKAADAFINFSIVSKSGETLRFKTGIPLDGARSLDSAVIKNFAAFQAALKEGRVEATLFVAGQVENKAIEL